MRARLTMTVLALAMAAGTAFAQDADTRLEAYKKEAARGVDEMAKIAQEMVDSVFSFGELGFQEEETSPRRSPTRAWWPAPRCRR